jgi:hypothetical protein
MLEIHNLVNYRDFIAITKVTYCDIKKLTRCAGVREQSVGERRARRADRTRRQLRRQQHGAGVAGAHAEHTGIPSHLFIIGIESTKRESTLA